MALHRDIFWVGRQWAVTGHGLQAVDQKQKSRFDIEIARLWDEDLASSLSAERWFNAEDFGKGLSIARERFRGGLGQTREVQPPRPFEAAPEPDTLPAPAPRLGSAKPAAVPAHDTHDTHGAHDTWASLAELARTAAAAPARKMPPPEPVAPVKPAVFAAPAKPPPRLIAPDPAVPPIEPPKRACLPFDMRIERSGARFSRMWRIRVRG